MRYASLFIQLPLFAVFIWLYLSFPRGLPKSAKRRIYDVVGIVGAFALSVAALVYALDADVGHVGAIWKHVAAALAAFHVFPAVLFLAWWLRPRVLGLSR